MAARSGEKGLRLSLPKRGISLHETHVCPTVVEDEDGELVYIVDGC